LFRLLKETCIRRKAGLDKVYQFKTGICRGRCQIPIKNGCKLPWDITVTEDMYNEMSVEDWCYLIEDYALHKLKVSDSEEDKVLYEDISWR